MFLVHCQVILAQCLVEFVGVFLPLCIGGRSPARKHKRPSPGSLSDTRSTTKLLLAWRTRSSCAPGSAKPVALRSNGSRKSGATTTDCSCQRLGRFGARLTRKPGARCACQRKCAHSFPLKFGS